MLIDLIQHLPHRPPFLFVSAVINSDPEAFEAEWRIDGSEDFLRGHFPGNPIVPGVLLTESLAQAAGLHMLYRASGASGRGMLVQSNMRFRRPVYPPASIALLVTEIGALGALRRFEVRAVVDTHVVADGVMVLAVPDHPVA